MAKKNKILNHSRIEKSLELMEKSGLDSIKIPIQVRLDGDLYAELKRRAEIGEGHGRYQTLLNLVLREALFGHKKTDPIEQAREIINQALDKISQK